MNREIKFRTWDPLDKVMHTDDDHISFVGGDGYLWQLAHPTHAIGALFKPVEIDCPVMQYTGLKDKNGTEIYEGDVVDLRNDSGRVISPRNVVELRDFLGGDYWIRQHGVDPVYEVIGNIYENPDLAPAPRAITKDTA